MKVDNNQLRILTEYFNSIAPDMPCPVCHNTDWEISDTIFEMKEFEGDSIKLRTSSVLPCIEASCSKCGYIHLFNAIKLGVVQLPYVNKTISRK